MLQDMIDEMIYRKLYKPTQDMIAKHFENECGFKMIYKYRREEVVHIYFNSVCNLVSLITNLDMVRRLKRQRKDRYQRKWLDKELIHIHNLDRYFEPVTDRKYCKIDY